MAGGSFEELLKQIRSCRSCEKELPLGPRPVLRASRSSKILIVGQAPGTRVHESGIPWNDPSGDRLRDWMQLDREQFYDESRIAIVPTGLCYPGKGKGGDLPPVPTCAPVWHPPLLAWMPRLELILTVGAYAQKYYLAGRQKENLTETVRSYREYLPRFFPLVHPSPRNKLWLKKNPWFEKDLVPELVRRVHEILDGINSERTNQKKRREE